MTDEEKKLILEWCGFALRCPPERDAYGRGIWDYPNGTYGDVDLDLNFYDKYAFPKLAILHISRNLLSRGLNYTVAIDLEWEAVSEDLAEALGQALLPLIKQIKENGDDHMDKSEQ